MTGKRFVLIKIPFLGGCLYLLFVALFTSDLADYDLWGYLAFGRIFWEEGYFPFHDVFSYTPTKPLWIYHEWLTGIIFYPIYKYTGAAGLQLLRYLIIIVTIHLMYLVAIKRGAEPLDGLIVLIPASSLVSFGYVPIRAQIFTYIFFTLTLYILESARKDQKWSILWWLLPIQVLWCNLHAGFIAGLGLIILFAAGEGLSRRKPFPFIIFALLAFLVTVINPYGIHYWRYILQGVSMTRSEIEEWTSVLTAVKKGIYGLPVFIFITTAFLGFLFCVFRRRKDYTDFLMVTVTITLGILTIRHSVFYGLIFGSLVPVILTEFWASWGKKRLGSYLRGGLVAILGLAVYWLINPSFSLTGVPSFSLITPSPQFPAGAYRWIKKNNFQGNILPQFEWGEFLIWYFYPACRVAMDGRYETVYRNQVTREYFDFLSGRDKRGYFLKNYPHDLLIFRSNTPADFWLQKDPAWAKVYADPGCVIYLHRAAEGRKPLHPNLINQQTFQGRNRE